MSQRSVVLSYAHQDDDAVLKLDATLRERGIVVWRDQARLRAREEWLAAIGRTIAEQKVFVLVWPGRAATSYFLVKESG